MNKSKAVLSAVIISILIIGGQAAFGETPNFNFYWNGNLLSSDVAFIGNQVYVPVNAFKNEGYTVSLLSDGVYVEKQTNDNNGTTVLRNGSKYTGSMVNGSPSGYGEELKMDGTYYQGMYSEGLANGEGRIIYVNGDLYVGEFVDGVPQGSGEIFYNDGGKYTGTLYKGVKHGIGKQEFANGNIYYGEWDLGLWSGVGRYTDASGQNTYAKWQDNRQVGRASRDEFQEHVLDALKNRLNN